MRITICDDEVNELVLIYRYVEEYIRNCEFNIEIKKFSSISELLEYEKTEGAGEIYLLDVIMPNMNGIELGREIRKRNKNAVIIYLTTSREFSLNAFSVRAFSYLIKPVDKEKLFSELNECISDILPFPNILQKIIVVKTPLGIKTVQLNEINAIEYFDHRLIYHLQYGCKINSIYQKKPFTQQVAEFTDMGVFVRSAESYFVNMNNICSIIQQGFQMTDGSEFRVTRKYANAKKIYLDFVMNSES